MLQLVDARPEPKMASRKYDDKYVKGYRNFLLKWKAAKIAVDTEAEQMKLFHATPEIYYAHTFHSHPDVEWREILEARLLAREPDDYIAFELSTIPGAIDWYENLFFNIRDRLASRSWVVKTILGLVQHRTSTGDETISADQRWLAYKLFAYFGGPLVLDIIISGFDESTIPSKNEKAGEFIDHIMQTGVRRSSSMAAQFFSVNKFNVMQLLEIQQRFMIFESEARSASGGAGQDYEANIERFFEHIPLAIGTKAREGRTPQTLLFEKTSVEPRADEQLALSRGEVPDSLKVKANYVRPESRNREGALTNAADSTDE